MEKLTPKSNKIGEKEKFKKSKFAELQFAEFGFTCNGFTKMYRSVLLEGWNSMLNECFLPLFNQKMNMAESADSERFRQLRGLLFGRFLENGCCDVILAQAKDHLNEFLFDVLDVNDDNPYLMKMRRRLCVRLSDWRRKSYI
ncbi:hypothetical protein niasHT_027559 [Heterodera trifolii]|uniref:Uncharacterized protein n=1 Tax=Heterodera trifolii TaxID=157864 RepID=A0ABD2K5F4_9BILA